MNTSNRIQQCEPPTPIRGFLPTTQPPHPPALAEMSATTIPLTKFLRDLVIVMLIRHLPLTVLTFPLSLLLRFCLILTHTLLIAIPRQLFLLLSSFSAFFGALVAVLVTWILGACAVAEWASLLGLGGKVVGGSVVLGLLGVMGVGWSLAVADMVALMLRRERDWASWVRGDGVYLDNGEKGVLPRGFLGRGNEERERKRYWMRFD